MQHQLELAGCTLEPMAAYLKAVAVFRLVSEQKDPTARGYWHGRKFSLDTELDREALEKFFLEEYRPTPIVALWNGGSGFSEGDRRDGIDAILGSTNPRFEAYRETIQEIFLWPEIGFGRDDSGADVNRSTGCSRFQIRQGTVGAVELIDDVKIAATNITNLLPLTTHQIKTASKHLYKPVVKLRTAAKKLHRSGGKDEIVRLCRNRLPDPAVDWIDCAVVLRTSTQLMYPPIVGTGGLEGRLDYTNSFMERISSLIPEPGDSPSLLRNALFGDLTSSFSVASTGQLNPGRAGGYNQGPGVETKDFPTNY